MPMTALRGVRISWLMLARNVLLARLAASAASLAWDNCDIGLGKFGRSLLNADLQLVMRPANLLFLPACAG